MLLPIILILFAGYWVLALFCISKARASGKIYPLVLACVMCFVLFAGDHVIGYLWFKWYTSTISVPGPVTLITSDMAVEDYRQDEAQMIEEGGGGSGWPPVFYAWNAARYFGKPPRYSTGTGSSAADITTGLSRLEVIDVRHRHLHPNDPVHIRRYSIVQRPDKRCQNFEIQSLERRKAQHESMATHGLANPEKYCIAFEIASQVTARFTERRFPTTYHHPREWTLPALFGVLTGKTQYIDNQTGQVVLEHKGATFYGGWVWQFVRFLPDMDYTVSEGHIHTVHSPAPCCRYIASSGINLLPYAIRPTSER